MKRRTFRPVDGVGPIVAALLAGIVIGWLLREYGPPHSVNAVGSSGLAADARASADVSVPNLEDRATPGPKSESPSMVAPTPRLESGAAVDDLRRRHLRSPIDGVGFESAKDSFAAHRSGGGGHAHEAVDLLAPRHTAVHAVENGTIAKLFESKAGGHTIYQFDPRVRFAYYYAHLDRYADGLREGQHVSAGEVIGYVGTSGNAPPNTPHLHFAIFELDQNKHWWQGRAIDPYPVFLEGR